MSSFCILALPVDHWSSIVRSDDPARVLGLAGRPDGLADHYRLLLSGFAGDFEVAAFEADRVFRHFIKGGQTIELYRKSCVVRQSIWLARRSCNRQHGISLRPGRTQARQAGVTFLPKPIEPTGLLTLMKKLLRKGRDRKSPWPKGRGTWDLGSR